MSISQRRNPSEIFINSENKETQVTREFSTKNKNYSEDMKNAMKASVRQREGLE